MVLGAIAKFLRENSSIQDVYPRTAVIANPTSPYLKVWEDEASGDMLDNGGQGVFVSCHVPPNQHKVLDAFITGELFEILDHKVLYDEENEVHFQVYVTYMMSPEISPEENKDGTLSRDRLVELPVRLR